MLAPDESTLKVGESTLKIGQAPRWTGWLQDSSDVQLAGSVLEENPLKGMMGTARDLRSKRVIVLGGGAVGGVGACLLSRSGVGFLDVVDPDFYGSASFATQPSLYEQRGKAKAKVQGEQAQRANPACRVRAAVCQAQDLLLRDLQAADLLFVAGDNIELLVWAARKAMALGKPLVQGAVHGETGSAIVRGYDLRDASNACPMCGMSRQEFNDQTTRMGCEIGARRATGAVATRTMPTICHAAGSLAANEAIKWLTDQQALAMRGEEFVCSLYAYQSWRTELPRNDRCRLPHACWDIQRIPSGAATLGWLAGQLGVERAATRVRGEIPWISFTICGSCERKIPVRRFARAGSPVGRCHCGAPLTTVPQGMRSVIPSGDMEACWQTSLVALGLELGETVAMLRGDAWVYFFSSEAQHS